MAGSSLTSIQLKLIKIGGRVVHHARAIIFQLAEVAVTGAMVRAVRRLRAPPLFARLQSRIKLNKKGTTTPSAALKSTPSEKAWRGSMARSDQSGAKKA